MTISATFTVVNSAGVSQAVADAWQAQAQYALGLWSQNLAGSANLNIRLEILDTTPSGRADANAAIWSSTGPNGTTAWETTPSWELRHGTNPNGTDADIVIRVQDEYLLNELFLDPTPETANDIPTDRTDGVSVMLHEIGHALGMIGFYDENTNTFNGGNHTPYDWRTGLVSGEVHFDGPNARAVYGNAVPLTNNNYTHYGNVNAPPGGNPLAGLMNGVAFYRGTRYEISALDLAVMADLGMGTVRDDVFDQTWLDVIRGGAGLDTFIGDYSARTTPMSIDAASGVVALPGLQLHEIEKLVLNLGTAADTFVGSDGEDVIRSGAGNDFLQGRGGNDTLIGDDGNDWLDGGAGADAIDGGQSGTDVAAYGASPAAVTMYLEFSSYSGGDADGDTLFHIANLSGSAFGDNLFGHAGGNLLWGQGGNDNIYGQGGSDQLFGGDGDDRLDGGAQGDVIDGGAGANDIAVYENSTAVSIDLQSGVYTGGEAVGDTFIGIEGVSGSLFADNLFGNGAANRLLGRAGNDFIQGRAGADTIDGGDGDDWLDGGAGGDAIDGGLGANDVAAYGASVTAVSLDLLNGVYTGDGAAGDTLTGIEGLSGSSFGDSIFGNASANRLFGQGGNDFIQGHGGADLIQGGDGNDDWLDGGVGADTIDGGVGVNDVAAYGSSAVAVSLDLQSATYTGGDATGDTLTGIEGLSGSALNDIISGNALANRLLGQGGNDTIAGRGGADFLSGGNGDDTFVFTDDGGADQIADFDDFGNDIIQLSIAGVTTFANVAAVMTQSGADVLIDFATTDILLTNTTLATVQSDDFAFV